MVQRTGEATGPQAGRWRLTFGGGRHAPACARREIAQLGLGREREEDLALLVSEVVTNAVRHGGARREDDPVVVDVDATGRWVRVRVLDGGDGLAQPREPGTDGGFGLHLVQAVADRWGASPGEVWFQLALR